VAEPEAWNDVQEAQRPGLVGVVRGGPADVAVHRAAEETGIMDVLTLDRTDFAIYRTRSGRAFTLVPV